MLKNLILLAIFFIVFTSCESKEETIDTDEIIVTGEVLQFDGNNAELYLMYTQPGMKQNKEPIGIDSLGKFKFELNSSIPMDAMILDKNSFVNINFIYHPGDSIHIQFSANDDPLSLFKTVSFTGDRKETNNDLIVFQRLRRENNLGYGVIDQSIAYRLDVKDFTQKMDTVKQKQLKLYNQYISEFLPNDEVKEWTRQYALQTYFHFLDQYGFPKTNLPGNYFDYNKEILPFSSEKLVGWSILNSRIYSYLRNIIKKDIVPLLPDNKEELKDFDVDSLAIDYLDSNVQSKLLSELLIARYYKAYLGVNEVKEYENHENELARVIKTPLIRNNLKNYYIAVREYRNEPNVYTKEIMKKMEGTAIEATFTKILAENEGKVLFIDCWATWCAPCIKAMPDSKKLIKEYYGKEVEFIYVCIESKEDLWKRMVADFNLGGGQHYFLNNEQSGYFRNALGIQGIPHYILIDKNKNIVESGNHLHPGYDSTKEKIEQLLN